MVSGTITSDATQSLLPQPIDVISVATIIPKYLFRENDKTTYSKILLLISTFVVPIVVLRVINQLRS